MAPYFQLRPNKSCDSTILDTILWSDYYNAHYCTVDDRALFIAMQIGSDAFAAMPYCRAEELPHYFEMLKRSFNEQFHRPLKIYLADKEAVDYLGLINNNEFMITEQTDLNDYLYGGEDLRELQGRKFQKKRNQISHFERTYEGRWQYVELNDENIKDALTFIERWFATYYTDADAHEREMLECEHRGIVRLMENCHALNFRMGGISIDGQIEAVSIGSYNEREKMAIISVEKANHDHKGLYQVINQQFMKHSFPDALIVNREDDMGESGLRQAKMSYMPIGFEKKYLIEQINI